MIRPLRSHSRLATRDAAGQRGLGLALALALALAAVAPAGAGDEEPIRADADQTDPVGSAANPPLEARVSGPSPGRDDGRRTMGRLPANLGRGVVGVFSRDNLVPLLVGGALTGVSAALDDEVRDDIGPPGFGGKLETAGGPVYSTLFVAALFTAGRFTHGARFRAATYDMLDAAIVNVAYTEAIKLATRRERPNGEDNKSFPSGHTSNAFALAAVAERHYGWKVGVPAYALAGLVGVSRLSRNKHYLSDVAAGATLGYMVGRAVVRVNNQPLDPGPHVVWAVSPILGRDARGMSLTVIF